jgi:NAD-dependent DNA ligase
MGRLNQIYIVSSCYPSLTSARARVAADLSKEIPASITSVPLIGHISVKETAIVPKGRVGGASKGTKKTVTTAKQNNAERPGKPNDVNLQNKKFKGFLGSGGKAFHDMKIVVTGRLPLARTGMKELVGAFGGVFMENVGQKTTHLFVGECGEGTRK